MIKLAPLLAATGVAAALLSAAASAEPVEIIANPAPTATVYFGDLDLATKQGHAALKNRVSHAASKICAETVGDPVRTWVKTTRCYKVAKADGDAQADELHGQSLSGDVIVQASLVIAAR